MGVHGWLPGYPAVIQTAPVQNTGHGPQALGFLSQEGKGTRFCSSPTRCG